MKTRDKILCLTVGGLLALAGGCGKTEKAAPQASDAEKTAIPQKAEPAKAAEKLAEQTTNMATAATDATKVAADAAAKVADTAATSATPAAPQSPEPVMPAADATQAPAGSAKTGLAGLSQDQMVRGLEDALGKGIQAAIARLGHDGGFLTNLNVKIPMPEKLQKVETAVRAMKQDKLADDFVATMNHAAEQAVPEAAGVFADALKQMTIEDAKGILSGPNDAATQYFQTTTRTNLYGRFYPIVQKATEKTGVTAAYKSLIAKTDVAKPLGSFGSALSGALLDKDSMDVDGYVTTKALDGLYKMVADEEKQIRQNPVARTTTTLQKVFGALTK
jgi:hypothetical protein